MNNANNLFDALSAVGHPDSAELREVEAEAEELESEVYEEQSYEQTINP